MKKKVLSVLLTAAMLASLTACGSNSSSSTTGGASDSAEGTDTTATTVSSGDQIIFGDSTQTSGDIYPCWTNNASDYNAYKMIAGMSPVEITSDSEWVYNDTVLDDYTETENEDGSKTWTFQIKDGLKWSNGDPITAEDYVFYYLFWSSDEVLVDLEAQDAVTIGQYVQGFDTYSTGESDTLKGVHLIDDNTFSVTIDAQYLPYYYGKALVSGYPEYMAGWVPSDVTIEETEDGCKFSDNFTSDYIGDTVDAFRYNPTACSGPYKFVSYDDSAYSYTLEINENYPGNYEGQTAQIGTVIYKYTAEDTWLDQLKTGAVDIIVQAAAGEEIDAGLDMVDEGGFDYISYDRAGYGKLVFKCNVGPTQFTEVRQAVAYLLDRTAFAQTFTGGHGTVVNGPYGSSQWMVSDYEDQIDSLNTYSYSLDSAESTLEAGGWTLAADGSDYTEGTRYKEVTAEEAVGYEDYCVTLDDGRILMPLQIEWFSSENNSVSDLLVTSLANNDDVTAAGMTINQTVGTFNELIQIYYNTDASAYAYGMVNMGEGFGVPYDVAYMYEPGSASNCNVIADDELYNYALAMNQTNEGDDDSYLENWFGFIERWNELLPDIPLYSNTYHDFFSDRVQGWDQNGYDWDVSKAILYTTVTD